MRMLQPERRLTIRAPSFPPRLPLVAVLVAVLAVVLAGAGAPLVASELVFELDTVLHCAGKDLRVRDALHAGSSYELLRDLLLCDPASGVVSPLKLAAMMLFLETGGHEGWQHDVNPRPGTQDIRNTGPFFNPPAIPVLKNGASADAAEVTFLESVAGISYSTHQRVRIYYSPGVVSWLEGGRKGAIDDGSMIVKQMYYADPGSTSEPIDAVNGWAVMFKDSSVSRDGWLWFLYFVPGNPTYGRPFVAGQYGMSFCLSCHSGTSLPEGAPSQQTFADLANISGEAEIFYAYIAPSQSEFAPAAPKRLTGGHGTVSKLQHPRLAELKELFEALRGEAGKEAGAGADGGKGVVPAIESILQTMAAMKSSSGPVPGALSPLAEPNPATVALYGPTPSAKAFDDFPNSLFYDHVVSGPSGPEQFISSDACQGCHNTSALLGGRDPSMLYTDVSTARQYNLSPYGEWSASMMGLAGRDPIFHAQLESERALRQRDKDPIANLCLSCHQAMGERQFHLDGASSGASSRSFEPRYTYEAPKLLDVFPSPEQNEAFKLGSLARDGVSCMVCHQITEQGLGTPSTFTAKFHVSEPGTVFGPFPDQEVLPYYMENALAIKPQQGSAITQSKLCGSCHTVYLPVIPKQGKVDKPLADYPHVYEQTTYLEWLNSSYNDERPGGNLNGRSCQSCHMPSTFHAQPDTDLVYTIANVEDGDFPQVNHRASYEEITPQPKAGYRRHTLVGANVFALSMFSQFPEQLGVTSVVAGSVLTAVPSIVLSIEETVHMAQTQSATVEVGAVRRAPGDRYAVEVTVGNLAGHKLPSGVGFRRAWIRFQGLAADGAVLWQSGGFDAAGVLLDADGKPLESEFTKACSELQPDFELIDDPSQVQVFEVRHSNDEDELTTSFLGLAHECKDNRLLPAGWAADGPYADVTRPVQRGGGDLPPSPGAKRLTYLIPQQVEGRPVAQVEAKLFYQTIPPYYLRDRFGGDGTRPGPERKRLHYMVNYLDLSGGPAENWALEMTGSRARLTQSEAAPGEQ